MKLNIRTLILTFAALLLCVSVARPATLTVDDSGGADFTSIQAAVNAAAADDVVYVYPGTYREQVVMKDRVNLLGYGPHVTTIDGEGTAIHVVEYSGTESAVLSGFRIVGSSTSTADGSWHHSGVHCDSGPLTIRNNIIENNKAGIAVQAGASPTIINNTIVNNTAGVIFAAAPTPPSSSMIDVLIIANDVNVSKAYQNLLAQAGMSSDSVRVEDVAKINLWKYRSILISSETGNMGQWGKPEFVNAIVQSQRPILGMGAGGASFYEEMDISLRWGNTWVATHNRLYVMEPLDPVFNSPYDIPIPKSRLLTLYNNDAWAIEVYGPNLSKFAVRLGSNPNPQADHYPLVREGIYTLWGHTQPPDDLTETGRQLLINVLRQMTMTCYPNLPRPELVATGSQRLPGGNIMYKFRIANWYEYPAQLFEPAPDLPPCGQNPEASRTWVDLVDGSGQHIYGYCGYEEPADMSELAFVWPADEEPPRVQAVIWDRRCDIEYASNFVMPRIDPYYTHTIMNNIIVSNNTGIFYYRYMGDGRILYNDVWANSYRNYHDNHTASTFTPQPGTGEISANPLFVDTIDYYLDDGSPCRDTGHPGPAYFDPDGTRNDMGAYGGPQAGGVGGHPGSGFIFTTVGNLPTSEIEQDPGHPSHGLAVVDPCVASDLSIPQYHDAPFGATLRIHGLFGEADIADGVKYYQILIAPWDGPSDPPEEEDFSLMTSSLSKVRYLPQPDGTVAAQLVNLGPKTIGTVSQLYELTHSGWWSHLDLRILWHTRGYENGKYTLTYKAYRDHPTVPDAVQEYFPASNDLDHITLLVDNSPVDVNIHEVKYDTASPHWNSETDGEIPECGIINLQSDTENLRFNITAHHAGGYLRRWKLDALWGKNNYAGVIAQETYPGVVPPDNWPGVVEQEYNSSDGSLIPWRRCAYQFRLRAWTRATNGYGHLTSTAYKYSDTFSDHYFIDFGQTCEWCDGADINKSGSVNFEDMALLLSRWLDDTCGPDCE